MGPLRGVIILLLAFDHGFGYLLAPSVSWPENYHFNAEEINMVTHIVKPFEIWYSEKHNRSRIDFYGGVVKRYYYAEDENNHGRTYMIHPSTTDGEKTVINCDIESNWGDQEDFLPYLFFYTYAGEEEHGGKQVQVWKSNEYTTGGTSEDILYVLPTEEDTGIPVQNVKREFNADTGALKSHVIINYYNFHSNIQLTDLDVDKEDCSTWGSFPQDLHTALKYLHPSIPTDVSLAFRRYKKHHDRAYEEEEHEIRKKIFRNNWRHIVDHNSKNLGFTLAVNQFADRTESELKYLSATKVSEPIREGTHPFPHTPEEIESIAKDLPEDYDLREEGVISPIENQASCGSCWAFAAAATVEGAYALSNGGKLLDLSEQSLVDCAWQYKSHGCQGTQALDAVLQYVLENGIPTREEYGPYLEEDGYCNIHNMTNVKSIRGFVGVTPISENAMRAAVYRYGPIMIALQATQNMIFYNSGVFYDLDCDPRGMNHAVTLVGYGVRDGDLYWIVKNSWGEAWGEDGFILISAKNNNCNVLRCPYYVLV